MNFLQRELKKILEMTQYSQEATCIGNASYVKVNGDVRLRLEFSRSSTSLFDGIVMTMLNRKEGPIDMNVLKFKDIWGKKSVSNPNFKDGLVPYIWEYREKTEWYVYKPNQKDYLRLAKEIDQYIGMFQEMDLMQGPQMSM